METNELLKNAGTIIGVLTGSTALIAFLQKQKTDRVMELARATREAEDEGRRKEREDTMKRQIDAAHDKIRRLSERQDELSEAVIGIQADMKNAVRMLERLDQKLDRLEAAR